MLTEIFILTAGLVLSSLMARKKGRVAPAKGGGDLPWFLTCQKDKWHDLIVMIDDDLLERKQNEKEWSCYLIMMSTNDGNDYEEQEVPFWAMDDFYDAVKPTFEAGDARIELQYRLSLGDGGINIGEFRES